MRKRSQRLWLIGAAGALGLGAVALAATALQDTVAFFRSPTDVVERQMAKPGQSVRIGGLVEMGSIRHNERGQLLFRITDNKNVVPVVYDRIPPDLFREGQGVVASGKLDENGQFVASEVLAKHDENYMPKEVYDALRKEAEGAAKAEPTT